MRAADLLPLLRCPLCSLPLASPASLRCGHSLCAHHLAPPYPCPLPACARVPPNVSPPRKDVTLNKILALVARAAPAVRAAPAPAADPPRSRPRTPSDSSARPRKRRRHRSPDGDPEPDLLTHLRQQSELQRAQPIPPAPDPLPSRLDKELLAELSCEICFQLLYRPITTPCQHTFCSRCLHRSLDHSPACPLCRQDLPSFSFFEDHPTNKVLLSLILNAFPDAYAARGDAVDAEERDARLDTPIFICQLLSFPGMPTLLHFFEPRYRLMLRRCLATSHPRFGMAMAPRNGPPSDFGTMLEIRSVQMLPDGRSLVETWGTHRFRILERGTLDGYTVGRIERIDDYDDDPDETLPSHTTTAPSAQPASSTHSSSPRRASSSSQHSSSSTSSQPPLPRQPRQPTNAELMATCQAFLEQLRHGAAPWVVQRLSNTYGPMPTDAASFSFWIALVLPVDDAEKARLLPVRSAHLRLRIVVHWIEELNANWWFTSGCVIV